MAQTITINALALMVKRGFDETAKKGDIDARFAKTASKEDIKRLEQDIAELRTDIASIGQLPAGVERRVDRTVTILASQ